MSLPAFLNAGADAADFVVRQTLSNIAPGAAGILGAWLAGASLGGGAVQGVATGIFGAWVVTPLAARVNSNIGTGQNQIHPNTVKWLQIAGAIAQFAVPVLMTMYTGNAILAGLGSIAPKFMKKLFVFPMRPYTYMNGLAISVLPQFVYWSLALALDEKFF